ncbi:hypothetical protein BS78_01G150100, partial [Paspalum vaginatum]
ILVFLFFLPLGGLGLSIAGSLHLRSPCPFHALFASFHLHRSSLFRFVSSPFFSVASSLPFWTAFPAKENRREGIFAEFLGSELVQELGVPCLSDWGHKLAGCPQ